MSIESNLKKIEENTKRLEAIESHLAAISANAEFIGAMMKEYITAQSGSNQIEVVEPQPEPEPTPDPQPEPEAPQPTPDPQPEPEAQQQTIDPKQVNVYLQQISANLPGGKPTIRKIMGDLGMTGGLGGASQEQMRDLVVEVDKQVAAAQANSFE